ncbi:uncharacterized protein [Triticum aestivum]|uniref:uncharacterized protein isoform X1 n=1 Tax=Triticum aestivum TaxID=4565 RepID=UPI001D0280E5|nr:uncharacterized protein LOC123135985 isoform X1 [Triticum aestivum]
MAASSRPQPPRQSLRRAHATRSAACAVPIHRFGGVRPPSRACTPKPLHTPPASHRFAPPCILGWVTWSYIAHQWHPGLGVGWSRKEDMERGVLGGRAHGAGVHGGFARAAQGQVPAMEQHNAGVPRRPAAMTSWLLATPSHAWPSTVIWTHAMAAAPSSSSTKPSHA